MKPLPTSLMASLESLTNQLISLTRIVDHGRVSKTVSTIPHAHVVDSTVWVDDVCSIVEPGHFIVDDDWPIDLLR